MNRQDILSQFIARTGMPDPELARDLLAGTNWDMREAERAFATWHTTEQSKEPSFATWHTTEQSKEPSATGASEQTVQQLPSHSPIHTTAAAYVTRDQNPCQPLRDVVETDSGLNSSSSHFGKHENDFRVLVRGVSGVDSNKSLLASTYDILADDVKDEMVEGASANTAAEKRSTYVERAEYTFVMPDLQSLEPEFAAFIEKNLIDVTMLSNLERAGRLNWCTHSCCKLYPHHTSADGNCLLHAASLGMWGIHDKLLRLRETLFHVLADSRKGCSLYRRWRWHQMQQNKQMELVLSEAEWDREWSELQNRASTRPNYVACNGDSQHGEQNGVRAHRCNSVGSKSAGRSRRREEVYYKSLEDFHVFVLAHILRRPIIVVADTVLRSTSGDALQPLPFGGIYLPLESLPTDCHPSPLLLAYDNSHFSALIPSAEALSSGPMSERALVPLTDPEGSLLPVHFVHDPGESVRWSLKDEASCQDMNAQAIIKLLAQYLRIQYEPMPGSMVEDKISPSEPEPEAGPVVKVSNPPKAAKVRLPGKMFETISRSISRKTKKGSSGTLKGKGRSREDLDEACSADVCDRNRADSTTDFLLFAQLLIKTVDNYDLLVKNYLYERRLVFERKSRALLSSAVEPSAACKPGRGADPVLALSKAKSDETLPKSSSPLDGRMSAMCLTDKVEELNTCRPGAPCLNRSCSMFGTTTNDGYCSQCYAKVKSSLSPAIMRQAPDRDASSQQLLRHGAATAGDSTVVGHVPSRKNSYQDATENGLDDPCVEVRARRPAPSKQNSLYDNVVDSGAAFSSQHVADARESVEGATAEPPIPSVRLVSRGEGQSTVFCASTNTGSSTEKSPLCEQQPVATARGSGSSTLVRSGSAGLLRDSSDAALSQLQSEAGRHAFERGLQMPVPANRPPLQPVIATVAASRRGNEPWQPAVAQARRPEQLRSTAGGTAHAWSGARVDQSYGCAPPPAYKPPPPSYGAAPQSSYCAAPSDNGRAAVGHAADRVAEASRQRSRAQPASLYYAQQRMPSPSPDCRMNGCRRKAEEGGLCRDCLGHSFAKSDIAQKLRRSMRQPRGANNFRL